MMKSPTLSRPAFPRPTTTYLDWMMDRIFFLIPAQEYVGNFLMTFQEFPPRQKLASFSIGQVMEKWQRPAGRNKSNISFHESSRYNSLIVIGGFFILEI